MEDERTINIPVSELCEALSWLEGALKCKEWNWSPDQWEYAAQAHDRLAMRIGEKLVIED